MKSNPVHLKLSGMEVSQIIGQICYSRNVYLRCLHSTNI